MHIAVHMHIICTSFHCFKVTDETIGRTGVRFDGPIADMGTWMGTCHFDHHCRAEQGTRAMGDNFIHMVMGSSEFGKF